MKKFSAAMIIVTAAFSATPSIAQTYNSGDHVEAFSAMSGKWEKAVIMRQDGVMNDGRSRYFVHADDPNIVNAYWGATADQLRASPQAGGATATPMPAASSAPAASADNFPTAPPPGQ